MRTNVHKCAEKCVGVLAMQGDFAEHKAVLDSLNVNNIFVRKPEDLQAVDALIIPGGESTVMMKLLESSGMQDMLCERVRSGMPVFGTCAGAILLSRSHLGLMDITVDRNAYGSQSHSFSASVSVDGVGDVPAEFIRAPKITTVGPSVHVLATYDSAPVLVQQQHMMASTFHTEVTTDTRIHQMLLQLVAEQKPR